MILAELHRRPVFYVKELLPLGHTRSMYVALLRSMNSLYQAGLIEVTEFMCWGDSKGKVAIHRLGTSCDIREKEQQERDRAYEREKGNVDKVRKENLVNV